MLSKMKKNKKGFTLVELIVVIAIIAILAAIAVPTTMHFVNQANDSKEAAEVDGSVKIIKLAIYNAGIKNEIKSVQNIIDIINTDDIMPSKDLVKEITIKLDTDDTISITMVGKERNQTVTKKTGAMDKIGDTINTNDATGKTALDTGKKLTYDTTTKLWA